MGSGGFEPPPVSQDTEVTARYVIQFRQEPSEGRAGIEPAFNSFTTSGLCQLVYLPETIASRLRRWYGSDRYWYSPYA